MQREIIIPKDEAEWLQMRLQDVTSTQSPALFNLSPYLTKFELYHAKASGLDLAFEENERMAWGKRLEPVIAAGVAEDEGWKLRKINEYIRLPECRMGSSFDYEIVCPIRGKGILEVKNVDYFIFDRNWVDEQAPEHIEIQLQHQLEVKGDCEWGCIVAFVGGNRPEVITRSRDHDMGAAIRRMVESFWYNVDNKHEPDPDFDRDGDVIRKLHNGLNDMADKTGDTDLDALASSYISSKAASREYDRQASNLSAQIYRRLGNYRGAYTQSFKVTASPVAASQGMLVTPEMVGTYVGQRKGHSKLYVREMGKKDAGNAA